MRDPCDLQAQTAQIVGYVASSADRSAGDEVPLANSPTRPGSMK
jgi:hypothetical protein